MSSQPTGGWVNMTQTVELLATSDGAANDLYGTSVTVSGDTAIVGAPLHMVGGNTNQGAAYVFSAATGAQQGPELTEASGADGDQFGVSLAVSGGTAVVGANGAGAAYVFAQSGTTWTQQAELTASDEAAGDNFGISVALSGMMALVGSSDHTPIGGNAGQGAAYVFSTTGTGAQQAELTANTGSASDAFGASVSLYGTTAIVGAPGDDGNRGAAYILVQAGTTWTLRQQLLASDGTGGDQFGCSVSVNGTTAIVGAPATRSRARPTSSF